jgi:hypothetical protein
MSLMQIGCEFSTDRKYRYTLWRSWTVESIFEEPMDQGYLQVIGLNPSTADETKNDPTVSRCIGYAKRWGFSALCMTNLFGWRATDPQAMLAQPEPIGCDNDKWLVEISKEAGLVLCAWGKHGLHQNRQQAVLSLLANKELYCLKQNADGTPIHPLYQNRKLQPIRFVS